MKRPTTKAVAILDFHGGPLDGRRDRMTRDVVPGELPRYAHPAANKQMKHVYQGTSFIGDPDEAIRMEHVQIVHVKEDLYD